MKEVFLFVEPSARCAWKRRQVPTSGRHTGVSNRPCGRWGAEVGRPREEAWVGRRDGPGHGSASGKRLLARSRACDVTGRCLASNRTMSPCGLIALWHRNEWRRPGRLGLGGCLEWVETRGGVCAGHRANARTRRREMCHRSGRRHAVQVPPRRASGANLAIAVSQPECRTPDPRGPTRVSASPAAGRCHVRPCHPLLGFG
jgi:hypothetical protein